MTSLALDKQTGIKFGDTFMGLDISSACIGWSVLRGAYYETGHINPEGENLARKLRLFRNQIYELVKLQQPTIIAIEAPFMGRPNSTEILYKFHGVLEERLADFKGLKIRIHAPTWKAKVCGQGGITTKDKEAGIVLNLLSAKGFAVGHIDEGDALCVALCARLQMFNKLK